jgi:hypothetical protein
MSDRGDIIDQANDRAAEFVGDREAEIRRQAMAIPAGMPGDCEYCGEWFGRLVSGACAPCRDRYRLP